SVIDAPCGLAMPPPHFNKMGRREFHQSRLLIPMIISSATDYREAARRKLPPSLFHYLDGGAGAEMTLRANVGDLQTVALKQRVLKGSETLDLSATWFGKKRDLPV